MSSETSAPSVNLGRFAPLRSTAEIIDIMEALRNHTPKTNKKKPTTPFEELRAKDANELSGGDCAEWIAKANFGLFVHDD